jgi:hypothetical protein
MTLENATPDRIKTLSIDHRGFRVPWFVKWINGKPDHRIIDREKLMRAYKEDRCLVCGEPLGRYRASILGPMCVVNRTISEPPSHRDCAEYALRECPFLSIPEKKRHERNLPEERSSPRGMPIMRNPGVAALWISSGVTPFTAHAGVVGVLFHVNEPYEVVWYCEGRLATREEVEASLQAGLSALENVAATEGPDALAELAEQVKVARGYFPK